LKAMRLLADPLRGVDNHAEEVVSRVAHVNTGFVAKREESFALRHGVTKPGFVLPRSTPNGPVPTEEGGILWKIAGLNYSGNRTATHQPLTCSM